MNQPKCPYCGQELSIVSCLVTPYKCFIAWGRCEECGMSSGCKSGDTEQQAIDAALKYLNCSKEDAHD